MGRSAPEVLTFSTCVITGGGCVSWNVLAQIDLLRPGNLALGLDCIQLAIAVEVGQGNVERSRGIAQYVLCVIDQLQLARSIVYQQAVRIAQRADEQVRVSIP